MRRRRGGIEKHVALGVLLFGQMPKVRVLCWTAFTRLSLPKKKPPTG